MQQKSNTYLLVARWVLARARTLLEYPRTLALYRRHDFLTAYREHTDQRVLRDPDDAVGETWVEAGRIQLEFLVGEGLRPENSLLEIGCGTLRAGRFFIEYLDRGRYTGLDLSPGAIAYGRGVVEAGKLGGKEPRLVVNEEMGLRFTQLGNERFDFLFAHSVFTHLMPEHIDECFAHLHRVLHPGSVFLFSFAEAKRPRKIGVKNFRYPFSLLEALAKPHGLRLERVPQYSYPIQQMVRVRLAPEEQGRSRTGEPG